MNYSQTIEYLFSSMPSFQQVGADAYKPGLERITEFCRHLGNPQRNYYTIHVAGTNGKGSVSHILASVLHQAGYRVGLYTSPHLKDFRERIRVDGEMIPKQKVVNFVDKNQAKMRELDLSFFEMSTAMAFDHFAHSEVEVAVIETGLGGRLDATNVITPILSVVTNVGMEHTQLLGDTLRKIAAEKAGIIKKSIPVMLGESSEDYDDVFEEYAAAVRSHVEYAQRRFRCLDHYVEDDVQHIRVERERDGRTYDLQVDLLGDYQFNNVVTAAAVADYAHEATPLTISRRAFVEGLASAAGATHLSGRWQVIGRDPLVICDTGHNAHGLRYVGAELNRMADKYRRQICVIGFAKDKNIDEILPVLPVSAHYIFTEASVSRAMPAGDLAALAAKAGLEGEVAGSVAEAVTRARAMASAEDMIFIGGSNFVVAEVL